MTERRASIPPGADADIRHLLYAAMAVFILTVAIGILNGMDLVAFDHRTLMAHIHAGTLGWITLSVLAVCFWLFSDESAGGLDQTRTWIAWLAIVSVPLLVLAFWWDEPWARTLCSLPVLAAILASFAWLLVQGRTAPWTTPRLAVVAAIGTLTLGAIFGTVINIQDATGTIVLGDAAAGTAHVAAMAFSYLVLIGMAIAEWRLLPPQGLSRAGAIQVGSLFVGGLLLVAGAITGITALLSMNLLFQLVAVAIFAARLGRAVLAARWLEAGGDRFFAASAIYVVVNIALMMFLIAQLVTGAYGPMSQDLSLLAIPAWLIFALDHAIFLGVMTNAIFGLLTEAAPARDPGRGWADGVVFWGMNLGLVGFVAGLAFDVAVVKQVFSPILGVCILAGLALFAARLTERSGAPTARAAHA